MELDGRDALEVLLERIVLNPEALTCQIEFKAVSGEREWRSSQAAACSCGFPGSGSLQAANRLTFGRPRLRTCHRSYCA